VSRNAIAHEYPDDHALRASAINRFFAGVAQLNALYEFVRRYLLKHFPNMGKAFK
jgi:hypothetical protein